jgi:hypothetical protein
MVIRRALAASVVLGLFAGCSKNETVNGTALFVVVEADPGIRMNAIAVNVTTRRRSVLGAGGTVIDTANFRLGPSGWPFTFVVQAPDTSAGAGVEIYAEVVGGGGPPLSVARALTGYTHGQTLVVPLMFWGGCTPTRCNALQTCQRTTTDGPVTAEDCGGATSAVYPPSSLATYSAGGSYGLCPMMQHRYGGACRPNPAPPMGDGGVALNDATALDVPVADVPVADVPVADVPVADVPVADAGAPADAVSDVVGDVPTDAQADAPVDAASDVVATDAPVGARGDVGADVVTCPATPVMCPSGGFFGVGTPSTQHCSACDVGCPVRPNAAVECPACACVYRCNFGFADCNMIASDGCEVTGICL